MNDEGELVKRSCDGCTACCIYFPFGEEFEEWTKFVEKPAHVPCRFLLDSQCSIYDIARPEICKRFVCAWKLGVGGDWLKPSSCGVMIRHANRFIPYSNTMLGSMLTESSEKFFVFDELVVGALTTDRMADFVKIVAKEFVVLLRSRGGSQYVGEKAAVSRVKSLYGAFLHYTGDAVPKNARITEWCFSRKHGSG